MDDDAVLKPSWLRSLLEIIGSAEVMAVTGPAQSQWLGRKVEWFSRELSWIVGSTEWFDSTHVFEVRNVWGNNMAVRRIEFFAVGGFTEKYGLHAATKTKWFDPPV
ncbi:MAG: hypothetical protein QW292_03910 [Candidatus Parvarchaeota archaeon]